MRSLGSLSSHFSFDPITSQNIENKKVFEQLLRSKGTERIKALISEHPELINEPLHHSYLTPLELSLSLKDVSTIKVLIQSQAKINAPNASGISFLDHIILMHNRSLLQEIFGSILGNIFYKIQEEMNTSNIHEEMMLEAQRQLIMIDEEIKRYQNLTELNQAQNPLIEIMQSSSDFAIPEGLTLSQKEIFDAIIYAILTHKNNVLESLYLKFGSDVLRLQTTDFKNLFDIGAIANNAESIEKLAEWGLTVPSKSPILKYNQNALSPFYYAIAHPTLNVFSALLKAQVPIPPPADLSALKNPSTINRDTIQRRPLDPFQLIVFKANLRDPLPRENYMATTYLLFEALQLILLQLEPKLAFTEEYQEVMISIIRTSFLAANICTLFSKTHFSKRPSYIWLITALCLTQYAFGSEIYGIIVDTLGSFSSYWKTLSSIAMLKKVWDDFSKYQNAYLYRPGKTLWTFAKDMFTNFLFVNTIFFDRPIDYKNAWKDFGPTDKPFQGSYSFNTKEALSDLKSQLKALHPEKDLRPCVKGRFLTIDSILDCLRLKKSIQVSNISYLGLSNQEQVKLARGGILTAVHPDLCSRKFPENQKMLKLCEAIYKKVSGLLPESSR